MKTWSAVLAVLVLLSGHPFPLTGVSPQLVTEDLEVNWSEARSYRGVHVWRWAEQQREVARASPVPVLVPDLVLREESLLEGPPTITTGENWYAVSIHGDEHTVLITGTTRRVRVAGAQTAELPVLGKDRISLTRAEGIVELSFMAFGAVYTINIECFRPDEDVRCTEDPYALQLAAELGVVNAAE